MLPRSWCPAAVLGPLCLTVSVLAGCAGMPDAEGTLVSREAAAEENDPLEPVNRQLFEFNLAVDAYLLKPVAEAYGEVVPDVVKTAIRNVLNNLREPFTLVNDIAQGEGTRAQETYGRFLLNTTFGLLGIFDVAKDYGVPGHREDFGQTLAVWGVPEGPYLVLPLLGPSNPRDLGGRVVQWYGDPVNIVADEAGVDDYLFARTGLTLVDTRWRTIDSFDALRRNSLDFYAAVRSYYRQRRISEISNAGEAELE
jgi:phospholipid-binding lipoprotein MlaA